jgi:hypothetical protein
VKIPDDIKQTVVEVAGKVLERGQQLGKEAQLQMQIKKLQVEHARKIHELGKRTYSWYQSGTMIVSGPVPAEVSELCAQLDATGQSITATQAEIEALRELARQAALHDGAAAAESTPGTDADASNINPTPALDAPPSSSNGSPPAANP